MSQIELNKNIKKLSETINDVNKIISMPLVTIDIESKFMTDRQIMKKIIMHGGDTAGEIDFESIGEDSDDAIIADEERAHLMVYGKLMYNDNGKLIDDEIKYPDCIDKEKITMKDNHPMKAWVKDKKKEVSNAVKQLSIKTGEISESAIQLGIEVAAAAVTIPSSIIILIPGTGIPVAFSSALSVLSSLQSFQTKLVQIIPILEPLAFASVLLSSDKSELVLGSINGAIFSINTALGAVKIPINLIGKLKELLLESIPPGVGGIGEEGSKAWPFKPLEPIELDVIANPSTIYAGETTKLTVNAIKGTWKYTYSWSIEKTTAVKSSSPPFYSTDREVTVSPPITTTYIIEVIDWDKREYPPDGSRKKGQVTIIVLPAPGSINRSLPPPDPIGRSLPPDYMPKTFEPNIENEDRGI